jgi:hypothetical protein
MRQILLNWIENKFGWICADIHHIDQLLITRFMRASWDRLSEATECGCCIATRVWLLIVLALFSGFLLGLLTRLF